mgnify:CR=1 FL=1|jgi:hypothetical protein
MDTAYKYAPRKAMKKPAENAREVKRFMTIKVGT